MSRTRHCGTLLAAAALGVLSGCARHTYAPAALDVEQLAQTVEAGRLGDEPQRALLAALGAAVDWPPRAWRVSQLGLIAIQRSLAVVAAQAAVTSALAAQRVAAQGPNPKLTFGLARNSDLDPGDSSRWSVGPTLEYTWSPVDRAGLRGALAATVVSDAQSAVLEAAWTAWHAATASALDLLAARERHVLEVAQAAALNVAVATAHRQVAAGLAEPGEWQSLRLQVFDLRIAQLDGLTRISRSGAALAGALILSPAALGVVQLAAEQPAVPPEFAAVQRQALLTHPAILRGLAAYERAERALELAVAEQYPEITVSPGYLFDQGDNVWSLLGGVVVPMLGYHAAGIASAAAERDAARARFHAAQAAVIADLRAAWTEWMASLEAERAAEHIRAELDAGARQLQLVEGEGVLGPLLVARAEVQLAALALTLSDLSARRRQAANELMVAARSSLGVTPLARYLEQLVDGSSTVKE